MMKLLTLTVLVFVSLLCIVTVSGIRIQGDVQTSNDFTYLGKFAYGSKGGNISIFTSALDPSTGELNATSSIYGQQLALFPDMAGDWETIEDSTAQCSEKLALAGKTVYSIGAVNAAGSMVRLNMPVSGRRPHWWYVVLVNCQPDNVINGTDPQVIDSQTGLPMVVSVRYDIEFTNGGTMWTKELSWEQHHVSEIAITFLIAYTLVLIALIVSMVRAVKQSINQSMMFLLSLVVLSQIVAQCLTLGYEMKMIHEQTITESINAASWWFDTFAQLGLLVSVLVMCAPQPVMRPTKITVGAFMVVYVLGYVASFAVNARYEADHPSLNAWMFNNWGGYLLCAVRLLNIGVIVHMCVQSIHQAVQQTQTTSTPRSILAYVMFASTWLASFPLITLIASMTVSYWRIKFFYGVNCLISFTMITVQVGVQYRQQMLNKSSNFKTMETNEVSMSEMNRSPNSSHPSSPRSPQSPSQSQFRGVTPV